MTTQLIHSGGIQQVFDYSALLSQIIYLDFDGELTSYNGEILTLDHVTVEDSGLTEERIAKIVAALNEQFAGQNVKFVTARPEGEYSTIYVGKTSSFEPYGNFTGLAETVDHGNKKKNDNAFVMLDSISGNAQIIATIAHEAGHLLGTLDHDGEGLEKYGHGQTYNVYSGVTSTGITLYNDDSMDVFKGGTAKSTTVNDGSYLYVSSGGKVSCTYMNNGGKMHVSSGGIAYDTKYEDGEGSIAVATVKVYSGGTAYRTTVAGGGSLSVKSGGTAYDTVLLDCSASKVADISVSGKAYNTTLNYRTALTVRSGGLATNTTVNSGGGLYVSSGGTALEIKENGGNVYVTDGAQVSFIPNIISGLILRDYIGATLHSGTTATSATVDSGGSMFVSSGGVAKNTTVGGWMEVYSGGVAKNTTVGGMMKVYSGGKIAGQLQIEFGVSAYQGAIIDFTVAEQSDPDTHLLNDWSMIQGRNDAIYTLTVNVEQSAGTYILADGAYDFNKSITVKNTTGTELGTLSVGETKTFNDNNKYTLQENAGTLSITIQNAVVSPPYNLAGDSSGSSWKGNSDSFIGAYTQDSYAHSLSFKTNGKAIDTYGMPAGTYDWRVRNADSGTWVEGNFITAQQGESPQKLESDNDGCGDIFFGNADGTWESKYAAQHVGVGTWAGTEEIVQLSGKNKITDVFVGSDDANLLVLTDDTNGDAVAIDDIYSAFPDEVQQVRVAQIDEIRAGAGDDVVDMTSQRFEYPGHGVTIRGGDGDDTIWANLGDNKLFGDAGDDRIVGASGDDVIAGGAGNDTLHGGGGNDIFCFCKDWGTDTVEQLSDGTVTLWFESNTGSWDQSEMTYTDGDNTVNVSGVSTVTIKYADDSEEYKSLAGQGAFMKKSSEKIFEEESSGVLAVL